MKNHFSKCPLQNIFTLFLFCLTLSSNSLFAAIVCDIDGNNLVDRNDLELIFQAKNRIAIQPFDQMDIDRNGIIDTNDVRSCVCVLSSTGDCEEIPNQTPIAKAGLDQTVILSNLSPISLDGNESSDFDGDTLNFFWNFQQRPENSQTKLSNANTVAPNFIPDQVGTYVLSLTVSDGFDGSSVDLVTVTVDFSLVQAIADINTTQSGSIVSGNIKNNDISGIGKTTIQTINQQGKTITFGEMFTTDSGGSFLIQADGNYTYTAPAFLENSFNEEFSYSIFDESNTNSSATLTITVDPVIKPNNSPFARPDSTNITAGGSAITGNLLQNDDLGDQPINLTPLAMSTSTESGGVFSLQNDGSYSYFPPQQLEETIQEILEYTITDMDREQSSSTLTITVKPQIQLPVARPDINNTRASGVAVSGNVLDNDELGTQLTLVSPIQTNFSTEQGGIFSLQNNGSYSYMPPESLETIVDEIFTYTIADSLNEISSSTLTITVKPENRIPVARPDEDNAITGSSAITGNVLINDDLGNPFTQLLGTVSNVQTSQGGVFTLTTDGSYTYLSPEMIIGNSTSGVFIERFDYGIKDIDDEISNSTLTITVSLPNKIPLARPDTDNAIEGTAAITGNVLTNDDLGNEKTLASPVGTIISQQGGSFTFLETGDYSYIPPTSISGVITEIFAYTITDKDNEMSSSTLSITVSPLPLTPLARPDTNSITAGSIAITGDVLANDDLGNTPTEATKIDISSTPHGGILSIEKNGSYIYTPPASISGVVIEVFTYTITDNDKEMSSSTLSIIVNPIPLIPLARPDTNSVIVGETITGNVLNNDDLGTEKTLVTPITITDFETGRIFSLEENGDYSYDALASNNGDRVDTFTFTYTITDRKDKTSSSTLSITINPIPLTPFARPDINSVTAGSVVITDNVLTNDDLGTIPTEATKINISSTPNGGSLNISENGKYNYTPPLAVSGVVTDIFTYTITDDNGKTSSSTLSISIIPRCTAIDDTSKVMAGGVFLSPDPESSLTFFPNTVSGNVLENDDFCSSSSVTVSPILPTPDRFGRVPLGGEETVLGGLITLQSDGSYFYSAPPSGSITSEQQDRITYTITDNAENKSSATLTITVKPQLLALPDSNSNEENFSVIIKGDALDNDKLGTLPTQVTAFSLLKNKAKFEILSNGKYTYDPSTFVFSSNAIVTPSSIKEDVMFNYIITDSDRDTSTSVITIAISDTNVIID